MSEKKISSSKKKEKKSTLVIVESPAKAKTIEKYLEVKGKAIRSLTDALSAMGTKFDDNSSYKKIWLLSDFFILILL